MGLNLVDIARWLVDVAPDISSTVAREQGIGGVDFSAGGQFATAGRRHVWFQYGAVKLRECGVAAGSENASRLPC
jgi:hypothetical protein